MFWFVCFSSVPSNSRVLMLLGQLERMNGEAMLKDVETARQVTAKILHLIQTQGKRKHAHTHIKTNMQSTLIKLKRKQRQC